MGWWWDGLARRVTLFNFYYFFLFFCIFSCFCGESTYQLIHTWFVFSYTSLIFSIIILVGQLARQPTVKWGRLSFLAHFLWSRLNLFHPILSMLMVEWEGRTHFAIPNQNNWVAKKKSIANNMTHENICQIQKISFFKLVKIIIFFKNCPQISFDLVFTIKFGLPCIWLWNLTIIGWMFGLKAEWLDCGIEKKTQIQVSTPPSQFWWENQIWAGSGFPWHINDMAMLNLKI